jgi:hypothetical protein
MTLQIDTAIGNRVPSPELHRMLIGLQDTTRAMVDSVEEIRHKAHSEGFNEQETISLMKYYLRDLKKDRIKYILYDKPRIERQKKLRENLGNNSLDANVSVEQEEVITIPTDHKVVIPDQVLEEATQEYQQIQERQDQETESVNEPCEEPEADYAVEELKLQLDSANNKITELTTQNKSLEEKYSQLEAKTRVSSSNSIPSNSIPAMQENNLRTTVVVSQIFREVLQLKGSKVIYANIVIDVSQNKYVRLEPLYHTTATNDLNSNMQKEQLKS